MHHLFSTRLRRFMVFILLLLLVGFFIFTRVETAYMALITEERPIDQILQEIQQRRDTIFADSTIPVSEDGVINVLILGLDARKGWGNPHCDAIHMASLNTNDWSVAITSVPRGTYSYIPPGTYPPGQYYLANACGYAGLEYGIEQIEKVLGIQADYYVTVGFSQVHGILRTFQLPTTQSLQWLRHRQTYAIGDPQRSHNQAVFMKDLAVKHLNRLRQPGSDTLSFVLFNMVNTNMDFGTMKALLNGYIEAEIDTRPDEITLAMKPYHPVVDYHFDFENPDAQIEALLERLRPYLSKEDLSDRDLADYQAEIIAFMDEQLKTAEGIEGVTEKALWLQIEDAELRHEYHYRYLEANVELLIEEGRITRARQNIKDYILEYTALENGVYVAKGEALLRRVIQ